MTRRMIALSLLTAACGRVDYDARRRDGGTGVPTPDSSLDVQNDGDAVDAGDAHDAADAHDGGSAWTPSPHRLGAGFLHTCYVDPEGTPRCWGWNESGQLGDGTGQL